MAGSILNKLLGFLKGFLSSMSSPLHGYSLGDVKVNSKDGEYSELFQFDSNAVKNESGEDLTDIKGEKIQLNVLISTANAKQALEPLLSGLNGIQNIQKSNPREANKLLSVFLGTGREGEAEPTTGATTFYDALSSILAATDNSVAAAQSRGKGLLGVDLTKDGPLPDEGGDFNGSKWTWKTIAGDKLKYSIECKIPDAEYGSIENVTAKDCSTLIPEYLVRTGVIKNKDEVKIDLVNLLKPLLLRMQSDLAEYYNAAYNKYEEIQDVEDTSEQEQKEAEAQQKQAEADAQKAQEEANKQVEDKLTNNMNPNQPAYRPGPSQSQAQDLFKSKQISITLRKIQGSTTFDVLALQSNYSPSETLDDIDDIISQDEFMSTLTTEPTSFTIDVDEDGYDIDTCESCLVNPCESLEQVLKKGITLYRNLYILHWMAKGNDMMKLHILSEEMYGELIQEIDTTGELLVEKCGTIPQPDWVADYIQVKPYEFQESLDILKKFIQEYIDCIDYAYPNQTSDVQSTLDEWLRYWNKQLNYFVERQEA